IDDSVKQFVHQTSGLGKKLAVMLWQFPRSFTLSMESADEYKERLRHLLDILPRDVEQAFEFRHKSWFSDEVQEILDHYHTSFVSSDSPNFPFTDRSGKKFVYIRFHGPDSLYASKYSREQLQKWATRINKFSKTHDVYCYFNNDMSGYAIA